MRLLFAFVLVWGAAQEGERYVIDAPASRFVAEVGATGMLSMFGHDHTIAIPEFSGEARLVTPALERSSLRITIEAGSLTEVGKGFSEDDRKTIDKDVRERALEVRKHPQIVFQSTRVVVKSGADNDYQLEIRGTLAMHGVTRPVTIPTRVTVQDGALTARGKFTVRHSDYKMERLSAAGGTIKAENDIRLSFMLVARKG
jgi:polyisoprenoid-binding protein YceI